MPWVTPTTTVEMEFAGVGGGWTDVTDHLTTDPIVMDYGIKSFRPEHRTAAAGMIMFGLQNAAESPHGILGYYSPHHASKRSGFGFGIRVRVKQVYSGTTRYMMGKLTQIVVEPGKFEGRKVQCVATDWMDEAARTNAPTAFQQNKRSDEVFSAILANVPTQPAATSIQTGQDTYVQALDNISTETRALAAFGDLARSELGYIFTKRDATVGQTLVFESRITRTSGPSLLITLNDSMHQLVIPGDRADVLNIFRVTVHPRVTAGYTGIVVARLDSAFATSLSPGESVTIFLNYTDPLQRDTLIGAYNHVTPVATTDYTMNSLQDGTGTDLTASMGVASTYFGSAVKFVVTNNHGSTPGFITKLQLRADGIAALNPVTAEKKDTSSITTYGENVAQIDMPYQSNPYMAKAAADFFANVFADPMAAATSVTFCANQSDALMTAAITGDISSLIALIETVSGFDGVQGYFINGVKIEVQEFEEMIVTWWLTPSSTADGANPWLLGTAGRSELGSTTILGFL